MDGWTDAQTLENLVGAWWWRFYAWFSTGWWMPGPFLPCSSLCQKKNHRQLQGNNRTEGPDDWLKSSTQTEDPGQKKRCKFSIPDLVGALHRIVPVNRNDEWVCTDIYVTMPGLSLPFSSHSLSRIKDAWKWKTLVPSSQNWGKVMNSILIH